MVIIIIIIIVVVVVVIDNIHLLLPLTLRVCVSCVRVAAASAVCGGRDVFLSINAQKSMFIDFND